MTASVKDPIWFITGNPFVDMGQEMMAALAGVEVVEELTPAEVKPLLARLIDLYFLADWIKSSYTIFPNSELNNGNNRREKYTNLLSTLLQLAENPGEDNSLGTTCAISGKLAQVYVARKFLPMSDFEGGNFQSGNDNGTPLNASVALALQFFPLGLVKVGKMLALPQFSNAVVQYNWAEDCFRHVVDREPLGVGGVRESGTFRTANAFFKLIERLLRDHQNAPESSVTLYLFNNFNQVDYKAASEIHYMPARVFKFIRSAMSPSVRLEWQTVVRRGYLYAKEGVNDNDLQKYSNLVYSNLLANKSISGFFIDRKRRRPVIRGEYSWRLLKSYLQEVRGMDQQRLDHLRDLGDRISPLVRNKTKRLLRLERTRSRGELTGVLYRLGKDAAAAGLKEPLITFDQLVSDVFPHDMQYSDWREVKHLLLFRVYELNYDIWKDDPEINDPDNDGDTEGGQDD